MERYDKYKDSGVEWIGEIPEGWEHFRYKNILTLDQGAAFKSSEYVSNSNVVNVRMGNIKKEGKIDLEHNVRYLPSAYKNSHAKYELFENDLIIAMTDMSPSLEFLAVPAFMEGLDKEIAYLLNQRVGKINSKDRFEVRYIKYLLLSYQLREQLKSIGLGTVQSNMSSEDLYNSLLVAPLKSEQTTIANYLDRKTAEIDQLIAQKEDLLCLYEEEKTAIINLAVTQGINSDVKLKDSGIDWLGDIPEHWEVKKLKYVTKIISKGTTPSTIGKSTTSNGDVRFIKAENISNNDVVSEPSNYIDDATNEILKRSQLLTNDILFVIAGATIGKVAILKKEFTPANTNQAVSFIRLHNPKYVKFIWYWLQSNKINGILWLDAVQSAQPNLSMENLGNFYVPFPELSEQTTIVHQIETETTRINAKITKTKKIIALQKEYRTALISEVVAGKIKVMQEAAS